MADTPATGPPLADSSTLSAGAATMDKVPNATLPEGPGASEPPSVANALPAVANRVALINIVSSDL
jgi:hypothetical protein